jgi:hypothetical protein
MTERINITTPVGRMVYGNLYDPETKDYEGKPLVGKDKVTPRVQYNLGIAVQKTQQHWANEPWGAAIWALAHKAFPNGETQRHDFAWKIIDGDSTIPNRRNRKPCEQEGYPGHWILRFSAGFPVRIFNADGSQEILEKNAVKPGYYIQVFGTISDNAPSASPGLYFNPNYVALAGFGPEIVSGPDVSAAGFGQGVQLPPGASAVPLSGGFNPAAPAVPPGYPAPPAAPGGYPAPPVTPATPPGYPAPPVAPVAPAPVVAVAPHPAILNVPGAPAPGNPPGAPAPIAGAPSYPATAPAPSAGPVTTYPFNPPQAPAPVARQLTAAAGGFTYEQLIANGWNDQTLIANGLMLP